jgi:transcriptional regulator with XRE-family HTH domain
METAEKSNNRHLGRKISRIRELRGMKQETLAIELGISQQAVSKLEQSEEIEDSTLEKIANVLGVSKEAIKNYSDESVINNIQNNYGKPNKEATNDHINEKIINVLSNAYYNFSSEYSTLITSSINYKPKFNITEANR